MYILHINCNYIGTTLHQLMLENLEKIGYKSKVFVPIYNGEICVIKPNENVCVSKCIKKWDRLVFDYKQFKILTSVQKNFDISKFAMLHAYTIFTDGNCAMRLSEIYGIPYVVAVRDTDVNVFFKKMIHLRKRGIKIMKNASAIYFLSESYKKQVIEKYVPSKDIEELIRKSYIVPNGIDDFWFKNIWNKNDFNMDKKINIIFVGKIIKRKNPLIILDAAKILKEKGYMIKITIVGSVGNKKMYKKLMKSEIVSYIPHCSKEKLAKLYRENDIFVMPSLTETFGLVYAEAMTQGLPVIYSRGQGFDGQFAEGMVGYAVNPNSPVDIAQRVLDIYNQYPEMSKRCVELCRRFEWKNIIEQYEKVYQKNIETI